MGPAWSYIRPGDGSWFEQQSHPSPPSMPRAVLGTERVRGADAWVQVQGSTQDMGEVAPCLGSFSQAYPSHGVQSADRPHSQLLGAWGGVSGRAVPMWQGRVTGRIGLEKSQGLRGQTVPKALLGPALHCSAQLSWKIYVLLGHPWAPKLPDGSMPMRYKKLPSRLPAARVQEGGMHGGPKAGSGHVVKDLLSSSANEVLEREGRDRGLRR